jgi:hypothetical protein
VKPPTNECEMFQGSASVVMAGEAAASQGNPVLTCHDVGMPAPVRSWRKSPTKSLMMAAANVIPISGGSVVMVGGAPTITMSASSNHEHQEEDKTLETIEIHVFDALELPLAGEKFELHLPNGDVEEGELDDAGHATVSDVPRGFALLILPEIDTAPSDRPDLAVVPSAIDGHASLPALPAGTDTTVLVGEGGDSMRRLCLRHRLVNWRAMFLDASNDALRDVRSDPAMLLAKDEVHVRVPDVPATRYLRGGVALRVGLSHQLHVADWPKPYGYSVRCNEAAREGSCESDET